MTDSTARRIGLSMFVVALALCTASIALELSGPRVRVQTFATIALVPVLLAFATTGALLVARLPENAVGWLFCAFAVCGAFGLTADSYVTYGPPSEFGSLPGSIWLAWAALLLSDTVVPTLLAFSFLLFPSGRLPSRRWRALAVALVITTAIAVVSRAMVPGRMGGYLVDNPAGLMGAEAALGRVADLSLQMVVGPLMLMSALSLFARRRRAGSVERQQLKWFAFAASLVVADVVLGCAAEALLPPSRVSGAVAFVLFVLILISVPVSMAVAILRYRLYDIDRIISRTLVYGLLTGALGLSYFTVVVVLQTLLGTELSTSPLAVAATTLGVAALFRPARARIQSLIDRRFNRRRYDAEQTVEAFGSRLRDEIDLDALVSDLLHVVRDTVQPAHASLWLSGSRSDRVLSHPGGGPA